MPAATTTNTTSEERAPWQPAQAGLQRVLNRADKYGRQPDRFVPVQGATTQQALSATTDIANQGSSALPVLQNVVGGAGQGFDTGLGQLQANANGQNLNGNPHLQAVLDRAAGQTANDVNQQFSAAGRYGSGQHAGTIADRVGALRNTAEMQNYGTERQNQVQAGNTLYNGGFQGAAQAGDIDTARLFTPQLLGQVGRQQDAQATAVKQAPLRATEWQSGLTNTIAQQGGTTSGTQTQSTSNPMGDITGALTTGLGLLSAIPTGGASLGLMGALGGAGSLISNVGGTSGSYAPGLPWAPR